MEAKEFFKIIVEKHFFTAYCPEVTNFRHKKRGMDGNKRPIEFTAEDKKAMKAAVKQLAKDIAKVKF